MTYQPFGPVSLSAALLLGGGCSEFIQGTGTDGDNDNTTSESDSLTAGSTTLAGTSGSTSEPSATSSGATDVTTLGDSTDGTSSGRSSTTEGGSSSSMGSTTDSASTGSEPLCGDGTMDDGEACDEGKANSDAEADACRTDCSLPSCGDGVPDTGEACDDGNENSDVEADACRTDCSEAGCGDGVFDTGETCDDENANDDDGCSMVCAPELGFACSGEPSVCEAASILINGDFEDSSGGDPIVTGSTFPFFFPGTALWFADLGAFVPAEAGITPSSGAQMLQFEATGSGAAGSSSCNIQQAIDMAAYSALIAEDRVTVEASSLFNRVDTATDSLFQVRIAAYSGDAKGGFTELATAQGDVTADLDQETWEPAGASLQLPATTTFVLLSLDAVENIENNDTSPEFAGHFADEADVQVVIAPPA